MTSRSIADIITLIRKGKTFEATAEDGSFSIKVSRYVPYVCTAIHDGGKLRKDLRDKITLDEYERWYEEDPHTADFISSLPIALVGHDTRFEYDLNRRPQECIYEEAWGKKVWKKPLTNKQRTVSLNKHENFYRVATELVAKLEEQFGGCLVYDLHSYNYKRWDRDVPLFNIGTERINVDRYRKYINHWKEELGKIEIKNVTNIVEENDVFKGRGYNLERITKTFDNTLVFATEISKVYCDEETGESYYQVVKSIQRQLKKAILNNAMFFADDLEGWKHTVKGRLLDHKIEPALETVDKALHKYLKEFELLSFVNPINLKSQKTKFFRSNFKVDPKFRYRPINIHPHELKSTLLHLPTNQISDISIRHMYESVINAYIDKVEMLAHLGKEKFLYNSLRYFGRPKRDDIRNAEYILGLPPINLAAGLAPRLDVATAQTHFERALTDYGLEGRIKVDPNMVADVMVLNSSQTVVLKEGARFTNKQLNYLVEHEIGVHMVTTMNSLLQPLKVFSIGLPVNTKTQEGLAVMAEYLSGNITLSRLRKFALRVIAVDAMCNGATFVECFNLLIGKWEVPEDDAFTIVTRVYRGGGFTKDYLYLSGFLDMFRFWSNGNDMSPLLVGKTSMDFYNTILELQERQLILEPQFITKSFGEPHPEKNNPIYDYILSGLK